SRWGQVCNLPNRETATDRRFDRKRYCASGVDGKEADGGKFATCPTEKRPLIEGSTGSGIAPAVSIGKLQTCRRKGHFGNNPRTFSRPSSRRSASSFSRTRRCTMSSHMAAKRLRYSSKEP